MPYWRLSNFYFFYFAALGALIPYWGLYLKSLGFDAAQIGELMAVLMATKIVAPNLWSWLSDHTGKRMPIVRLASLLTALSFAGVFFATSFWWLALVMLVFSFFWNASLPQLEVTTLTHLGDQTHRYSIIRMWGSIGFILTVVTLGALLDQYRPVLLPLVILALLVGIWLTSLRIPEQQAPLLHLDHEPLRKILRRPAVLAFLAMCFLMAASHGPYYTFYSIYLQSHDYSRSLIGQLWALGVLAEIGVFLIMPYLLPRLGLRLLLLISFALASLRWLLIGWFVDKSAVLIFAQLLHGATFGSFHAVAIHMVNKLFTGNHRGRGQALYSSVGLGAGGAIGSLYSGYLWVSTGPLVTFSIAALLSACAFISAWFLLRGSLER
ncbi:MAG: MFS transporter [Gammaproteobacteria bacterium]